MRPTSSSDQTPQDSSRPEFWDVRYERGETPWDFHGVPKALKMFLQTSRPGNVLIPGCGLAYEVRAFHDAGWNVAAVDFSTVAVARARSELGPLGDHVVHTDFFKHDFASQRFDLIYERTFLCALPPDLWPAYVERVKELLVSRGKLAGIFLYGDQSDPPPYPLTEARARELFEDFSLIKSAPVSDSLPLFAGNEQWQEWMLKS